MDTLRRQIRLARRRLAFQQFLRALSWCWFAALLVAAVLIAIDKYHSLGVEAWGWVVGALGVGALVAAVWTLATRRSELEAALEIDRRFGLKERISSSLMLGDIDRETSAGRALVQDAIARVERLAISEQFRVQLSRWSLLPLAPMTVAFLVATLLDPAVENRATANTQTIAQQKEQIKKSTATLQRKLSERKKEAEDKGLKTAEDLLEKLEQGTRELSKGDEADRKQALVKLNDLAKDLEQRRQSLGGSEKLRDQLQQMKNLQKGPADKMADALRQGDLKQAIQELNKLRDELKNGKLDEQAKEQLAKQLDEMEQKLRQMADAQQKQEEHLKQQIEEKRKAGQENEARDLERQLEKLAQQKKQMEAARQMADKLAECADCMKKGDGQGAAQQLDKLADQLGDLQKQLDEKEMLNDAMAELTDAKDAMNCKACDGAGCKECNGRNGNRLGQKGQGNKDGKGQGDGLGAGRGKGFRPENKDGDSNFFDTRVRQKVGKGSAVVSDLVDGSNAKGRIQQEIKDQVEAAKHEAADPLTGQQLPRGYRDHAKEYFDALREGSK
jgi:hypothetical protein